MAIREGQIVFGDAYKEGCNIVNFQCNQDTGGCKPCSEGLIKKEVYENVILPCDGQGNSVDVSFNGVIIDNCAEGKETKYNGKVAIPISYSRNTGATITLYTDETRGFTITQKGGCSPCTNETTYEYDYTNVKKNYECDELGSYVFSVPYSAVTSNSQCKSTTTLDYENVSFTLSRNTGTPITLHTFKDGSTITQKGGCSVCTDKTWKAYEVPQEYREFDCNEYGDRSFVVTYKELTRDTNCIVKSGNTREEVVSFTLSRNTGSTRTITSFTQANETILKVTQDGGCSPCEDRTWRVYKIPTQYLTPFDCEDEGEKTIVLEYTDLTRDTNCVVKSGATLNQVINVTLERNTEDDFIIGEFLTENGTVVTIKQKGGCKVCEESTVYTYHVDKTNYPCDAEAGEYSYTVFYTGVTTSKDCTTAETNGSSADTVTIEGMNLGQQKVLKEYSDGLKIYQDGGCQGCENKTTYQYFIDEEERVYACDALGTHNYTVYYTATTKYEDCTTETTNGSSGDSVTITAKNTGSTKTLKTYYDENTVSIEQLGGCVIESVKVYIDADVTMLPGDTSTSFTINYWAENNSGTILTDNLTLNELTPSDPSLKISYTYRTSGTTSGGKLYKTYNVAQNNVNKIKSALFQANYQSTDISENSRVLEINQSGKDMKVLPPFDFLTFTFDWNESGGKDLDTATFVKGTNKPILDKTLDELPVGFGCYGGNSQYSAATIPYLEHGGDNTTSGNECALVNWKTICDYDYISEGITKLYCELYGNWYYEKGDGKCSVTFKTYSGDSMHHGVDGNPYIFVPTGNTYLIGTETVNGTCYAYSSANASDRRYSPTGDESGYYSYIAEFVYDIASKTAFMSNKMTETSGRDLRAYALVNGELLTASTSSEIGYKINDRNVISKDAQDITVTITDMYATVNGSRVNLTKQEPKISYYGDGEKNYASTSFTNNILTFHFNENNTGARRNARTTLTAKNDRIFLNFYIDIYQDP